MTRQRQESTVSERKLRHDVRAWTGGLGFLALALAIGLLAWQSVRDRDAIIEREKDSLSRLAQIVAIETKDMFGRIDFFFRTADLWLSSHPRADPRFDPEFIELVDAFRSSMDGKVDIRLVSETGGLYYIPSTGRAPLADVSDRSYYRAQLSPVTRGFYIANAVQSRVTNIWGIPISFPLSTKNGGISVIFATVEMPVLEELYERVRPKPNGAISIVRKDGRMIARIPFDAAYMENRVADDADAWWKAIGENEVFTMRALSTDNETRIIASKRIEDPVLAVSISATMDDVLSGWKAGLPWRGALALAFMAAIGAVSAGLASALRKLGAAQAELADSVARLRESDATKDKLFSILAHDLRGPIGGTCNLLDTMAQDLESLSREELGKYLSALRMSSWNTYQLLENLLAWSRSKRGDMPFRPERTRVLPLVEECAEVYGLALEGKRLSLAVDVDPALEARADPNLLKVVLRNLISNAIKFSRGGGTIFVSGRAEDGGAAVTVRDEGIGMDAATKAGLFDLAETRSRAGTASEGGSGLGLILCKDIAALHGGRIAVESDSGSGSAFTVFLPD